MPRHCDLCRVLGVDGRLVHGIRKDVLRISDKVERFITLMLDREQIIKKRLMDFDVDDPEESGLEEILDQAWGELSSEEKNMVEDHVDMEEVTPRQVLDSSFRVQDGCHNCAKVFALSSYMDGRSLYCTLGSTHRPNCGSLAMGETFGGIPFNEKEFDEAAAAWEAWSEGREVSPAGKCDQHIVVESALENKGGH